MEDEQNGRVVSVPDDSPTYLRVCPVCDAGIGAVCVSLDKMYIYLNAVHAARMLAANDP